MRAFTTAEAGRFSNPHVKKTCLLADIRTVFNTHYIIDKFQSYVKSIPQCKKHISCCVTWLLFEHINNTCTVLQIENIYIIRSSTEYETRLSKNVVFPVKHFPKHYVRKTPLAMQTCAVKWLVFYVFACWFLCLLKLCCFPLIIEVSPFTSCPSYISSYKALTTKAID